MPFQCRPTCPLLPVLGGDLETARGFIVRVRVHPVVKAGPLRVGYVEFFVGEFACVRLPPRLGGEAFQHARPAAPGVFAATGMQAGEDIGDGAPSAEEVGFRELCMLRGKAELSQRGVAENFGAYAGEPLRFPDDAAPPELAFLSQHRTTIFRKA